MKTLLWIIGLAGGWVALNLALNVPRERRFQRLARSRAGGDAFSAFRQSMPEIPEDVLRAVYRGVQNLVPGEDFPVRAEDSLFQTLEVDEGSLADLPEELLADPSYPITTVGDLARAVWQRRRAGD
jgi:hypothetical protein